MHLLPTWVGVHRVGWQKEALRLAAIRLRKCIDESRMPCASFDLRAARAPPAARSHAGSRKMSKRRPSLLDRLLLLVCPPTPRCLEVHSLLCVLMGLLNIASVMMRQLAVVLLPLWLYAIRELYRRGGVLPAVMLTVAGFLMLWIADTISARSLAESAAAQHTLVVASADKLARSCGPRNMHLLNSYADVVPSAAAAAKSAAIADAHTLDQLPAAGSSFNGRHPASAEVTAQPSASVGPPAATPNQVGAAAAGHGSCCIAVGCHRLFGQLRITACRDDFGCIVRFSLGAACDWHRKRTIACFILCFVSVCDVPSYRSLQSCFVILSAP